ncbi:DUF167 domain-containing protein [Nioella nitratireducens]|uniref:DUF167 domain-containing protein n=1 Tax=Nioella nitratireducens TaxID=1287720 RepID=UPI0008FD803B|nr:DUF167 domain-containing protein [Nioella nitratireducens]
MAKTSPDLCHLAVPGARLALRVTPKASRNAVTPPEADGDPLRVYVTTVPEGGKANAAVLKLLSKALGVPKSRLEIVQGATGRDKVVEVR